MDAKTSWRSSSAVAAAALLAGALLTTAGPAAADEYDPRRAGHPLRIVAYALHPVGVALDYLIFRPAHWLGHREPIQTIFGHTGTFYDSDGEWHHHRHPHSGGAHPYDANGNHSSKTP